MDDATLAGMGNKLMGALHGLNDQVGDAPPLSFAQAFASANNLLYALEADASKPPGRYSSLGRRMRYLDLPQPTEQTIVALMRQPE